MNERVEKAKEYFDRRLVEYLECLWQSNVEVRPALMIVFVPLLKRWNDGERSEELAEEMEGIK